MTRYIAAYYLTIPPKNRVLFQERVSREERMYNAINDREAKMMAEEGIEGIRVSSRMPEVSVTLERITTQEGNEIFKREDGDKSTA